MIPILYDSTETAFVSNGLGRLRDAVAVRVVEERNSIYECDFDYPVDGAHFDEIIPGRIIAVTHDDTGSIQPFDIVSYSRPINGIVTFHAVHISYRLTGQVVWSSGIYNSENAIALFNGVSGTPFTFSSDFIVNNTYMAAADGTPRTVRQMMGGIEGSFIDAYGGEWEFDKWNVIAHKSRGEYRDFAIRYGINLIDYKEDVDYLGTYTSCVPYWRGNVDGKDVIVRGDRADADLPSYSGRRVVIPLDLSDKFENRPTATQLQTMALTMMNANQTNMPSQSISVDFIRLQDTPEYAAVSSLLACSLCDTVDVIFPMYNQKARFKIVRVEWDALAERYISMELGTLSTTLAEALGITETPTKQMTGTDLAIAGDLTVGGSITSGGKITAGGRFVLPYNTYFAAKDANGNEQGMLNFYGNHEYFGNASYPTTLRGSEIYLSNPIQSLFKVTDVSKSVSAIAAHSYQSGISFSMTAQSGYNAVGVVGWFSTNFRIYPFRVEVTSNTNITASLSNATAAASSDFTMHFYVLWLKATSA